MFLKLKSVPRRKLLGATISEIIYISSKDRIIFKFYEINDIMIKTSAMDRFGTDITENNLFSKNHKLVDYKKISKITIKDIGWEGFYGGLLYLFFVDTNGDVYRTHYCNDGSRHDIFYDYTDYVNQKIARSEKIKKIFGSRYQGYLKLDDEPSTL